MKISKSLLPAAALVALFAGCQDEDFGVSVQEVKNAKYAQTFQEMFGKIDPNQDWSMAKQVTASISGVDGDVLEIYYQNPISSNAVILARKSIVGGEATVSFDMAKNVNRVYVQVKKGNNGYYPVSGYFNVVDGTVDFSKSTRAQVLTGDSRMTKGEAYTRNSYILDPEKKDQLELYTGNALLSLDFIDGFYRPIDNPGTAEIPNNIWCNYNDWYTLADFTNFIPLQNVLLTTDERPEIRVSDITSLFVEIDGEKPLFTEKQNHVKYMKPGSTPQLRKDLVFTMAEDGPMYLDYFFKGTEFDNTFGYFYYKGDAPTPEQFRTMPKYVLTDNMSTSSGKVVYGDKDDPQPWNLLQMRSGNAQSLGGIDGLDMTNENTYDNIIYGTRFQLTYFGDNNELTTGKYEFPAGTKIGLFILGYSDSERSPKGKDSGNATIFTSLSDLNLKMSNNVPHAASFSYNGKIVYGMEDMLKGSDFDLNDMMFFVNGNFVEQEEEITPPAKHETEIWIAACEDLGGTYDYDFNDLVFGIQKTLPNEATGKSDLYIIPLAAGGTMKDEIFFNGNSVGEIHGMLGSTDFTSPKNVEDGSNPSAGEKIKIATGIDGSLSINQLMSLIHIQATKKDAESGTSSEDGSYNIGYNYDKTNNVPQVLLLPQGWGWPSEETCIDLVYPKIKDWISDASVTDWVNDIDETFLAEKPGKLIPNPIQPAVPGEGGEGQEGGGSGEGGSTPTTPTERWNITLTGSPTIKLNGVETYTATVEGIDDFTGLDVVVTCGTYNSDVAAIVENSLTINGGQIQFQVKGKVFYDVTIYVKVTGDETHRDTRKEMRVSVVEDVPEFYFKTTIDNKDVRISEDSYTLDVVPTNTNLNLGVEIVKGDGNAIVWSSSDESIVNIVSNSPKRVACGTVTLTATHKAVEGSYAELAKSIELTIAKLDPNFTLTGVSPDGSITVEEEKNVQLAANYVDGDRNVPYTFDIEDPTVASVSVSGNTATITGLKIGSTTITVAQAESGFYNATSKEVTVNVTASLKPEAEFTVSPSTIGMEVGAQAQINKVNMIDGDLGSLSCSIDKPEIVELVGTFNAWNPNTIKAKAKGTATITITHAATTQYKAHSETITVKVGEAVEGQPVDITKYMGSLQHVSKEWINENAALVDMSEFEWAGMASAKLRITGSANGQVSVSVIEGNDFVINRNTFSNGVIEGSISKLVGKDSFYIVDHAGGLTVTKLEIIPITIE